MNNAIGWICAALIILIIASCTAHREVKRNDVRMSCIKEHGNWLWSNKCNFEAKTDKTNE